MTFNLEKAISLKDADLVEDGLDEAFRQGLTSTLVQPLIELLEASWHSRHEDVARALQFLKPPEAVPALLAAARKSYPQYYDDGLTFIRKCTWALADIGTDQAKQALEQLSNSSNVEVVEYANKRLRNWSSEAHRKGA